MEEMKSWNLEMPRFSGSDGYLLYLKGSTLRGVLILLVNPEMEGRTIE